jgi:hypothetical protein
MTTVAVKAGGAGGGGAATGGGVGAVGVEGAPSCSPPHAAEEISRTANTISRQVTAILNPSAPSVPFDAFDPIKKICAKY